MGGLSIYSIMIVENELGLFFNPIIMQNQAHICMIFRGRAIVPPWRHGEPLPDFSGAKNQASVSLGRFWPIQLFKPSRACPGPKLVVRSFKSVVERARQQEKDTRRRF